jgi:hypothetical protein
MTMTYAAGRQGAVVELFLQISDRSYECFLVAN